MTRRLLSSEVEAIVKGGADVDRPNPDGMTPMIMALDNGSAIVARYLLDRGAKVNARILGSRLEWDGLPLAAALVAARAPDKTTMAAGVFSSASDAAVNDVARMSGGASAAAIVTDPSGSSASTPTGPASSPSRRRARPAAPPRSTWPT